MDIPAILNVIRPAAQWSRASDYTTLSNSWADGVQQLPSQAEINYAWENVDSKLVLTTNATDTVTPLDGVPDIVGDGVANCTITITKKKSNNTTLTTPTLLDTTIILSGGVSAGASVVVGLSSSPSNFNVGERVLIKEGATEEGFTVDAVDIVGNTVTANNLANTYTAAATVQRCVEHNDTIYLKTTGGKLSAESVNLANGTANVTLTSANETKVVTITAWDGGGNGIKDGTLDIQFRA